MDTTTQQQHKPCETAHQHMISYLSKSLRVETKNEVSQHLEKCINCSKAFQVRHQVQTILQGKIL